MLGLVKKHAQIITGKLFLSFLRLLFPEVARYERLYWLLSEALHAYSQRGYTTLAARTNTSLLEILLLILATTQFIQNG